MLVVIFKGMPLGTVATGMVRPSRDWFHLCVGSHFLPTMSSIDWAASRGNKFPTTLNIQSTIIITKASYVPATRPNTQDTQSQLILFKVPEERHSIINACIGGNNTLGVPFISPPDHTLVRQWLEPELLQDNTGVWAALSPQTQQSAWHLVGAQRMLNTYTKSSLAREIKLEIPRFC